MVAPIRTVCSVASSLSLSLSSLHCERISWRKGRHWPTFQSITFKKSVSLSLSSFRFLCFFYALIRRECIRFSAFGSFALSDSCMAANVSIKSKPYLHQANNVSVYAVPEANTRTNSPSPPSSPPLQSSFSHCRRRPRTKLHSSHPLREFFSGGVSLRRSFRNFVFLPLLYVSGLIMCVGPFSAFSGKPLPPGSLYRSHETFQRLWNDLEAQNSSTLELSSVWKYKRQKEQKPCLNSSITRQSDSPGPSGYLLVDANGGLNQQRSAICNAVAVAGLLNAILVIPRFEFHSVWKDSSTFADIYDEDHFIATLDGFVKVVKDLPQNLLGKYDNNISNVPKFRVQAWAPTSYYMGEVYPVLQREGVIRIAPFANRLAMSVPPQIQFLRCLANYEALRFSSPIIGLAQKVVSRMIEKSSNADGKYLSTHLRFEEDMVAFSCCVYDGGESEKIEMDSVRERAWREKFKREDRIILPGLNRVNGKCPLTPLEVGLMLRGMGFGKNTSMYLASGKIFQGEKQLAPLRKMFPQLHTKETLATAEELAPFMGYSSRLAALDYTVCLFSEVFVTSQGGNFPHFLMGHRRFLNDGHAKTIMPDKPKLAVLLEDMSMSWNDFKEQMELMLSESDRKGLMVPRVRKINRKTSVYTFPLPECRCLQRSHDANLNHDRNFTIMASNPREQAIDS